MLGNLKINKKTDTKTINPINPRRYRPLSGSFPNAYNAFKKGLVIPIGEHISEKNAHFIANKINNFF